ncbi:DUF4870 domain-containing protein [Halorubrum sp. CBA1125]|uniref:DUF4870 domain-containing protein n=1 Tax=Halorubrum sp. CBA1125 TaxID=2668072 RepID=UPI0012E73FEA|nr:DUF4870 domain-containing protein [Halorubrum sp. CBA1125]MUW15321.1 DUF4870 domain-containing protein [Halorubrum sp. CBA1125]
MTSTTTSTTGPELLEERSVGGVLVHLLALLTGFVGAVIVFVASSHEFTRANARNALNWHLSVFVLTVVATATFVLGADTMTLADGTTRQLSLLPAPLDAVFGVVGMILLVAAGISWFLTFVFALVAAGKAVFGTAWRYPGSVDLVGRYT